MYTNQHRFLHIISAVYSAGFRVEITAAKVRRKTGIANIKKIKVVY